MPGRSVNPDILFNTIKEDQENGTSKASEMLKQAFPGVGNSCDDLASLFGQALMQDDSDKVSLVVTAPPSFSINASQIMETMGGKVLFPDNNDFEISEEYKTGAAIALVFKEETKN